MNLCISLGIFELFFAAIRRVFVDYHHYIVYMGMLFATIVNDDDGENILGIFLHK